MAQSEFKEYIHVNLALVLPHVEQNDDLVQNKKMLPNGLVFYYMYLSEMNDEDKIKEAMETSASGGRHSDAGYGGETS
nr:hypothetical protein P5644_16840 [Bacillus velezensis]